jgi:hypothetical protein
MARKITTQACNAFMKAVPFKSGNTTVTIENVNFAMFEEKMVVMRLHGNKIAQRIVGSNDIEVSNGGWNSNTTKERLNGIPGVCVNQKAFVWYLNGKEWDGSWEIV